MEAANMTFREEVVKLRSENKYLRIENTNLKKRVHTLTQKVQLLLFENQQLRLENRLLKQNQQLLVLLLRRKQFLLSEGKTYGYFTLSTTNIHSTPLIILLDQSILF